MWRLILKTCYEISVYQPNFWLGLRLLVISQKQNTGKGEKTVLLRFPQHSYLISTVNTCCTKKADPRHKPGYLMFVQLEEKHCQTNGFKNNRIMPRKSWDLRLTLFVFHFSILQGALSYISTFESLRARNLSKMQLRISLITWIQELGFEENIQVMQNLKSWQVAPAHTISISC